jgi:hypothetical protein
VDLLEMRHDLFGAHFHVMDLAAGLGPGVPNIGHRAGEQRPGLAPISPVVIDYFADRPRPCRPSLFAKVKPIAFAVFMLMISSNFVGS